MNALRSPTKPENLPTPWLTRDGLCDICNGYRARGNHKACFKARQARYAQSAKESK